MTNHTAAEINAERIEAIVREFCWEPNPNSNVDHFVYLSGRCARKIVEAFPDLRLHQQTMERGDDWLDLAAQRVFETLIPERDREAPWDQMGDELRRRYREAARAVVEKVGFMCLSR